ncbi:hypothetical protein [Streptomyces sp. NPDC001828]|uniref:hypothetical protein n=1 Tax=Streptomyces sp. NPDC001828 TaxID=3364615 RepID=UPI003675D972
MTTPELRLTAIDRDTSPLLDADHDAVRIADTPRRSPHITFVAPGGGGETVSFRDADGTGFELSLTTVEPDPGSERVAYAWDALAAAIGDHRHFIRAVLEQPSYGPLDLNTITELTRTGNEHTLTLTAGHRPADDQDHSTPAADRLLVSARATRSAPRPNSSTPRPPPGTSRTSPCASTAQAVARACGPGKGVWPMSASTATRRAYGEVTTRREDQMSAQPEGQMRSLGAS